MSGSGTPEDPYIITDVYELQAMELNLSGHYELGNDIDASATSGWNGGLGFDPIGKYQTQHPEFAFSGSFDGKGYKITNLFINRPTDRNIGLFGYGWFGKGLKNVGLQNCNISGKYLVGAIVGYCEFPDPPEYPEDDYISNCWSTGNILTQEGGVGGLFGYCGLTVENSWSSCDITVDGSDIVSIGGLIGLGGGGAISSYSTGDITAVVSECAGEIGGFIGEAYSKGFSDCYATGDITIVGNDVDYICLIGGFAGTSYTIINDPVFENCYARGDINIQAAPVYPVEAVGGFLGFNDSAIDNCYSTGNISIVGGIDFVGGFCGMNDGGVITDCFWDIETSQQSTSDGGIGKTTSEMKTESTFTSAGWDFDTIWDIDAVTNDGYPYFQEDIALSADFTWSPEYPETDEYIDFNASNSTVIYEPATYKWEFGDGVIIETSSETITHSYAYDGDYKVILTITDNASNVDVITKKINIWPWYLLDEYAPVLYLHIDDQFLPRDINSILNESDLVLNGYNITNPSIFDLANNNDDDFYLDMRNARSDPDELIPDSERFFIYPHKIYGRLFVDPDDDDYIVLQYWIFYPYNNWERLYEGEYLKYNYHESDWEMVIIVLDRATEIPQWLACAQHLFGEDYPWEEVTIIDNTHPKIFIGQGSHASYPVFGEVGFLQKLLKSMTIDISSDNGTALYPCSIDDPSIITGTHYVDSYSIDNISHVPEWVEWEGNWNDGDPDIHGPGNQGEKWTDPFDWSQDPSNPFTVCVAGSPVNLHAYDIHGNHVGLNEFGEIEIEIPNTYLYQPSDGGKEIIWIYTDENIRYEIEATGSGEFDFHVERYFKSEDIGIIVLYEDIQLLEDTLASLEVSIENPDYTMEIDLDGDGIVDEYIVPDEIIRPNNPPIADAGGPYTGTIGIPVILDGSNSSDQDGTIISYEWDLNDDGEYDDATGEIVEYTWTEIYSGNVSLKVTDDDNATSTANTAVTITESTGCVATFNFTDQNGDLTGSGDERVYIDNIGWKVDGEQITVEPGTTVYYRAYYKEGSGLYGPKLSQICNTSITIDVPFHTIAMDFEDQYGTFNGTGDERVYLDHVGYKADGETVAVPLDSTVYHRAYYKEGSGLYGPKLSTGIDGTLGNLTVIYHTIAMDFEDQYGTFNGTGDERVYLDHVGYKADGETVAVPLDSTVYHRTYYKEGSGLYGPKLSAAINGTSDNLSVMYHTIAMDFTDQNGSFNGTGDERVYLDHIGYKAHGETVAVPLDSTVYHRTCYKEGSGLYGPKLSTGIDGINNQLTVTFRQISFLIIDEITQDPVYGAQVYVDHIGYIENGGMTIVPQMSTIYHKANIGDVWSEKTSKEADETWTLCLYQWDGTEFNTPDYE